MVTVREHYAAHLAPLYPWTAGDTDHALRVGTLEVASLGLPARHADLAVDLGAGFGMHAIPLARMGYAVIAIDASPELIDELGMHAQGLSIRPIVADLVDFRMHVPGQASLILCLGDTLAHLDSKDSVEGLFTDVAACLAPGGRCVVTFRDDTTRIPTRFLEESDDSALRHGGVPGRHGDARVMQASAYPELRLDPDGIVASLARCGLAVQRDAGPRGRVRLIATRGRT